MTQWRRPHIAIRTAWNIPSQSERIASLSESVLTLSSIIPLKKNANYKAVSGFTIVHSLLNHVSPEERRKLEKIVNHPSGRLAHSRSLQKLPISLGNAISGVLTEDRQAISKAWDELKVAYPAACLEMTYGEQYAIEDIASTANFKLVFIQPALDVDIVNNWDRICL